MKSNQQTAQKTNKHKEKEMQHPHDWQSPVQIMFKPLPSFSQQSNQQQQQQQQSKQQQQSNQQQQQQQQQQQHVEHKQLQFTISANNDASQPPQPQYNASSFSSKTYYKPQRHRKEDWRNQLKESCRLRVKEHVTHFFIHSFIHSFIHFNQDGSIDP